jgi:hypothetical protein
MHCYRLDNNKALKGLPAQFFKIENARVKGGFIEEASVSLIIPHQIDAKVFRTELGQDNTNCFQFGETWLRKPRKEDKDKSKGILVSFDWADYWPDKNLGDRSTLITWEGTYALYECRPGETYIRNRGSGEIFTNDKNALTLIPAEEYKKLSSAYNKKQTTASVKEHNVLLDYVLP